MLQFLKRQKKSHLKVQTYLEPFPTALKSPSIVTLSVLLFRKDREPQNIGSLSALESQWEISQLGSQQANSSLPLPWHCVLTSWVHMIAFQTLKIQELLKHRKFGVNSLSILCEVFDLSWPSFSLPLLPNLLSPHQHIPFPSLLLK